MQIPSSWQGRTRALLRIALSYYVVYATIAHALLNPRYRVQMLADTLQTLSELMRTQAQ